MGPHGHVLEATSATACCHCCPATLARQACTEELQDAIWPLQVDASRSGRLTALDIAAFLCDLGLEPTATEVGHIVDELDWSGAGVVTRWGAAAAGPTWGCGHQAGFLLCTWVCGAQQVGVAM